MKVALHTHILACTEILCGVVSTTASHKHCWQVELSLSPPLLCSLAQLNPDQCSVGDNRERERKGTEGKNAFVFWG